MRMITWFDVVSLIAVVYVGLFSTVVVLMALRVVQCTVWPWAMRAAEDGCDRAFWWGMDKLMGTKGGK